MVLPPDQIKITFGKIYKAGILAAPFRIGLASFSRLMAFLDFAEKEHKAAAPFDHYYIMTMGVLLERQGKGIGKKLMAKALETQNKNNVSFYQSFGFKVVSDKEFQKGGLHNWGMLRQKG